MRNLIVIVVTDPNVPPCVVQGLKQVRLHVEASTWCGKKVEAPGVFQGPDDQVCPACAAAIQAFPHPPGAGA